MVARFYFMAMKRVSPPTSFIKPPRARPPLNGVSREFRPSFQREQCRTAAEPIRAYSVDLKVELHS